MYNSILSAATYSRPPTKPPTAQDNEAQTTIMKN